MRRASTHAITIMLLMAATASTTAFICNNHAENGHSSNHFGSRIPIAPTSKTFLSAASSNGEDATRREFFQKSVLMVAAPLLAVAADTGYPSVAFAAEESAVASNESELIEVYFGCGCFWHVQHEFVEAERRILKRSDSELTARAGYAGGKAGALDGKVCYHNAANLADYGTLGHGEVVRLNIPPSSFSEFAKEYFNLFDKKGDRPDQFGDRGSEYRNLVGIPGGLKSEYAKQLVQASVESGDKLDFSKGRGSDPDARALAFVMDTAEYPFFVGEQYHQFHDGFNIGENYPNKYNGLAGGLSKEGSLGTSDCPNGTLGLGVFGL